MDVDWGVEQLERFTQLISLLDDLRLDWAKVPRNSIQEVSIEKTFKETQEILQMMDSGIRVIIAAAGESSNYNVAVNQIIEKNGWEAAKRHALMATGLLTLGAEARRRMKPDAPELAADNLHPWVWEAARPLWESGSQKEAVNVACRSVNARLQQKLGRSNLGETALVREALTRNPAEPGKPRLRFPGDRDSDTWKSRQDGSRDFGAGCFLAIRNPVVHDHGVELSEQEALEQLAALSLLSRWIDICTVESADESVENAAP
ncbi:TIGR02391 family protein [Micromonospora sp. KLBMP9576]|uniref:TIGR02391 family protein n=1 Tax=Micromonospora sp. KLBMP9576 TaxID=3424769 RepID=UPI003D8DD580